MADDPDKDGAWQRQHKREELVFGVVVRGDKGLRHSGGVIDLSAGGLKVRIEGDIPAGTEVRVDIPDLKFVATGIIVRSDRVPDAYLVGIRFKELQEIITGKLLEYKIRRRIR